MIESQRRLKILSVDVVPYTHLVIYGGSGRPQYRNVACTPRSWINCSDEVTRLGIAAVYECVVATSGTVVVYQKQLDVVMLTVKRS
jgi:hypothetical protein